jgi:hypothetical protein
MSEAIENPVPSYALRARDENHAEKFGENFADGKSLAGVAAGSITLA